jgi:lipoprotein-anchoring transpeptidase ErfK/SrfK
VFQLSSVFRFAYKSRNKCRWGGEAVKHSVLALLALSAFATTTVAHSSPELVGLAETFQAGTNVVRKHERLLYFVTGAGQAVRYPVGVGRIANQWTGTTYITAKYSDPSWIPPANMRREKPRLPPFVPGGSPQNPMGVATMTLSGGELAIHGTNQPNSIGRFLPHGCIRMFNEDIADLYRRVGIGTPVIVE